MFVTGSRITELRRQKQQQEAVERECYRTPLKEATNSSREEAFSAPLKYREVHMTVTAPDLRATARIHCGPALTLPSRFDGVSPHGYSLIEKCFGSREQLCCRIPKTISSTWNFVRESGNLLDRRLRGSWFTRLA